MNIRDELLRAIDALNAQGVSYALCGGLAVVIHGYVRLTDDIDMLIPQAELARAKEALKLAGFGFVNPVPLQFQNKTFPVAIHRVVRFEGEEHLVVDLIEVDEPLREIWNGREPFEWEGRKIHVVSRAGLLQMKRNAGRAQDVADIEHLRLDQGSDHGG